jgi:hypothetical protein
MGVTIPIEGLPGSPLDAAADFHAIHLPKIRHDVRAAQASNLVLVFAPAGHEHRAWRLAAIQELARELAPIRVNALVGADEHALDDAIGFLGDAPGITGQLLAVELG